MASKLKILTVTIATAGTRQRVVTSPFNKIDRYPKSAHFRQRITNSGNIYIGDETVSSTVYSDVLQPTDGGSLDFDGDTNYSSGAQDEIDLYNTWVDAGTNGDKVFVSILVKST